MKWQCLLNIRATFWILLEKEEQFFITKGVGWWQALKQWFIFLSYTFGSFSGEG